MTVFIRSAFASCFVALWFAAVGQSQDAKAKPQSDEDAKLTRIIERWIERNETERDHVMREVGRGDGKPSEDDFAQWFTRLGGDGDGWDRGLIQRGNAREIFDRIAQRLNLQSPVLSRDQFVQYARDHWRKDKASFWREPTAFDAGGEAAKLFKHLDEDRDGYLTAYEMSPALRADLKRWDRNQDGWINFDEYRGYFVHRLDRAYREMQQKSEKALPPLEIAAPADERPTVLRAGKLPPGLPGWFELLDTDQDGQVALHEWCGVGWPSAEFKKLDLNDDGLLEAHEVLKLLAVTERDGSRPFAYLLQKRIEKTAPKTPPKGAKQGK